MRSAPAAFAQAPAPSLIDLLNAERSRLSLRPLTVNATLTRAAQEHAERMARAGRLSHTFGGTLGKRLTAANYPWSRCGENIAWTGGGASSAFWLWMGSRGHRENMLSAGYTEVGIGVSGPYWCLILGKR